MAWIFGVVLVVILSLFAYIDVWYFLRSIVFITSLIIKGRKDSARKLTKEELLKELVTKGVVMPSDLDFNLHMNNSKYLREMDFGRFAIYIEKGLRKALGHHSAVMLVGAISIRYRRSLQLFQKFEVHTRILAWEEKVIYLEQRIVNTADGFVASIALVKMAIKGTTASELLKTICGHIVASPFPSAELRAWQESISLSSKHLREESSTKSDGGNTQVTNSSLTSTKKTT
ncbi:PREDICTED: protein THEM6-like [Amphimedon queenslandica]|uniref:Protein THEM6 n=1 Tax=Amphimedon queenslandica TaxID=400682 RepID=A0A1X7VQY5_AMPQE|nr:PREDICTED: protein THEM6-like [Amphimedon queenslandica]|eukprot:XP_003383380.1 PREDICTED: protein THEM6-like [Amphimedon queenslandica]